MGRFRDVELDELELAGPRLTLRPWRLDDVPAVVAAMGDPEMRRFLALPDPYGPAEAREFVEVVGGGGRRTATALECAVVETGSQQLAGSATLRLGESPDIGYWIAPSARGHGYAAEATDVLSRWGFDHGMGRIEVRCDVANVASARAALAAGHAFDGIRRGAIPAADGPHDLAVFGRLAGDSGAPVPPALPRLPAGGLSDGVVALRILQSGDAQASWEMDADPLTVATGFSGVAPTFDRVRRMTARAELDFLVGAGAGFAIVDVASAAVAGGIRLRYAGPPQVGGIGYVVHPDFRGRGFTARALRLLAGWAFEQAGFARLELGAKQSNLASQRAALAGGFEPDAPRAGRLRTPEGTFVDEARFFLLNPRCR